MSYLEAERKRAVAARDRLFKDPGQGPFFGRPREFVLRNPEGNLWEGVRQDALAYFKRERINWWGGNAEAPTGHLLSSQVACVNHLFPLRQRADTATALLQAIDPEVEEAVRIERDGFVAFEFVGPVQRLGEKAFTRGANCTSVDAALIGRVGGKRRLYLIEWKYTESYSPEDKYVPQRAEVYDRLVSDPKAPFVAGLAPRSLYWEPFYQLMRQTLLGWLLTREGDLGCTDFRHVHVVPEANREFHNRVTAPALQANRTTVTTAWRAVLKRPDRYMPTTPERLLSPVSGCPDTASHLGYLRDRYWPEPV